MKAFILNLDLDALAMYNGDIFVQSPFSTDDYVLHRNSNASLNIELIKQRIHMFDCTEVNIDDVPHLRDTWKAKAQANIEEQIRYMNKIKKEINDLETEYLAADAKLKLMSDVL